MCTPTWTKKKRKIERGGEGENFIFKKKKKPFTALKKRKMKPFIAETCREEEIAHKSSAPAQPAG